MSFVPVLLVLSLNLGDMKPEVTVLRVYVAGADDPHCEKIQPAVERAMYQSAEWVGQVEYRCMQIPGVHRVLE